MFPRVPADRRGQHPPPGSREAVTWEGPLTSNSPFLHPPTGREAGPRQARVTGTQARGPGSVGSWGLTHTPTQQLTTEKTKTNC